MSEHSSSEALSLVLVTAPDLPLAEGLARALVEERLAACVNILPGICSVYRWQGAVESAHEVMLMIKTRSALVAELTQRVRELHSYQLPEVIALPLHGGSPEYLRWLSTAVRT